MGVSHHFICLARLLVEWQSTLGLLNIKVLPTRNSNKLKPLIIIIIIVPFISAPFPKVTKCSKPATLNQESPGLSLTRTTGQARRDLPIEKECFQRPFEHGNRARTFG